MTLKPIIEAVPADFSLEFSSPEEEKAMLDSVPQVSFDTMMQVMQVKQFPEFLSPAALKILRTAHPNTVLDIPLPGGGKKYALCRFIGNWCPYVPGKGVEMKYVRAIAGLFNRLVEEKVVAYGTLAGCLLQVPLAPAGFDQVIIDSVMQKTKLAVNGFYDPTNALSAGLRQVKPFPEIPRAVPDRAALLLYVFTELEQGEFDKRVGSFSLIEGAVGDGDWTELLGKDK